MVRPIRDHAGRGTSGKILYVVDATATLFRAYYGMNKLSAPDGREVGGILGFCQSLSRFARTVRPEFVTCVFDAGEVTFRNDLYPLYKANRVAPPADLLHQFDLAFSAAEALGFRSFRIPGYEADDLMATIAHRGMKVGITTILVTPDKDVQQLVGKRVKVMDPRSFSVGGPEEVRERFGVAPDQLPDLLSLAGDSTDNIPGVPGVGLKTAVALILEFGSLEEIYRNLDQVGRLDLRGAKNLPVKLGSAREEIYLYRDLVRLRTEAPLSEEAMTLGMLRYGGPRGDADSFFDALGFHGPLRALRRLAAGTERGIEGG
jgi:DNA polymerase-1